MFIEEKKVRVTENKVKEPMLKVMLQYPITIERKLESFFRRSKSDFINLYHKNREMNNKQIEFSVF